MWSYNLGKSWVKQDGGVLSPNYECVHLYSLLSPSLFDQGTLGGPWGTHKHICTQIPRQIQFSVMLTLVLIAHQLLRMPERECLMVLIIEACTQKLASRRKGDAPE